MNSSDGIPSPAPSVSSSWCNCAGSSSWRRLAGPTWPPNALGWVCVNYSGNGTGNTDANRSWPKASVIPKAMRARFTKSPTGLRVHDKKSGRLKMPGYDTLNDLMHKLDPAAYARALNAWLQSNAGSFPRSLALDGKSIGDGKCGMII